MKVPGTGAAQRRQSISKALPLSTDMTAGSTAPPLITLATKELLDAFSSHDLSEWLAGIGLACLAAPWPSIYITDNLLIKHHTRRSP
jgi:hypothetical protein